MLMRGVALYSRPMTTLRSKRRWAGADAARVDAPALSSSSMIRMARTLGAPVMDPMGKVARKMDSVVTSPRSVHCTVEII